ncbi:hypothetical protein OG799_17760 [Micromonospora sp. NBC_00898]|uniref:hypothetical protein n=1 Tax=Micromonospora sp. NBC_00898 TaxID=2975981 RepID=UPI00386315D7|nr:hypothetical protein OG799_17760 [Micromonospora sp. NBC_00898]
MTIETPHPGILDAHPANIRGTFVVSQQAARGLRRGGALINFPTPVIRLQFPNYGVPQAIWVVAPDGRIHYTNPAATAAGY